MFTDLIEVSCLTGKFQQFSLAVARICRKVAWFFMWFPKIKKTQKLKSGLNGGQNRILFFVHVNMNVSRIILISARASETAHFIKGKADGKWNTLAILIQQNVFFQGVTDHKSGF